MKSVNVSFTNAEGQQLKGKVEFPVDQQPVAFAIFAHCFTCSKNLNAVRNISRGLNGQGIAVLRFDFTGLGESEGEFSDTNFSSNLEDLERAAQYLEEHYEAPQLIIGHSLGGAAVLRIASKIDSVRAVVTIGAPFDPPHVKHLISGGLEEIEQKGEAEISIGGRPFKIKKQFVDDLEQYDCADELGKLNKALLVIHSPQDTTVSIDNAARIYEAARHPKSFVSLDGADHLMSNNNDSIYAGEVIASWSRRYLSLEERAPLKAQSQVSTRTGKDGYTTEIAAGKHHLLADEPESVGGEDLGPNPYDYLLTALGACTGMTLKMYADRKGLPMEEVRVHLEHSKVHCEDGMECEQKNSKIDRIQKWIEIDGPLDEAQRQRMLEIADRCPVHRTLHSEVLIETTLKDV